MRSRFTDNPQFEAVSEEAERLRFFKDFVKNLKVSGPMYSCIVCLRSGKIISTHIRMNSRNLVKLNLAMCAC